MELFGIGIGNQSTYGVLKFLDIEIKKPDDVSKNHVSGREIERFLLAKERTILKLDFLYKKALDEVGEKEAQIFEIHKMLLCDEDLNDIIEQEIKGGAFAEEAISIATNKYIDMLIALNDPYLSARVIDLKDLSIQLISNLSDEKKNEKSDTSPCILVSRDLTPSQTMSLDKSTLLGFVTFEGSSTSHTSILARAMNIPALVGVGEIDSKYNGCYALLDAEGKRLIINPTQNEIREYERKKQEKEESEREKKKELLKLLNSPAISKNGHRVHIYANIGSEYEVQLALENGAEGIGLLRSELLYLTKSEMPSEEELFLSYKGIISAMQGKRVIIRTLDVGADKKIPYLPLGSEENPALGLRGIRVSLANKDVFKSQIRAILRASVYGKASIMLPMIASKKEIIESKELIEICKQELFDENQEFDSKIELGIMVETPASAIMCKELASEVAFFSVGTNDLTQYTLAADRQNPRVAHICSENLEPVLRLIEECASAIHERGGFIGICGELASDTSLTQRFVDMKIDELSASAPLLINMRKAVNSSN